jgi:hypothetical protein
MAELVAGHGLGGALQWGLLCEPNEEIWPALEAGPYPLALIAGAMTERFEAAVPRAEIVCGSGHEIDYPTVASWLSRTRARTRGAARSAPTPRA